MRGQQQQQQLMLMCGAAGQVVALSLLQSVVRGPLAPPSACVCVGGGARQLVVLVLLLLAAVPQCGSSATVWQQCHSVAAVPQCGSSTGQQGDESCCSAAQCAAGVGVGGGLSLPQSRSNTMGRILSPSLHVERLRG